MKSLRVRLIVGVLFTVCLLIILSDLFIYLLVYNFLSHDFDSNLLAKAQALSSITLLEPAGTIEMEFSQEGLPSFLAPEGSDYYQFWFEKTTETVRSLSLQDGDLGFPQDARNQIVFRDITLPNGDPGRAVSFAYQPAKDPDDFALLPKESYADMYIPTIHITVAQNQRTYLQTLDYIRWVMIIFGLLLSSAVSLSVPRIVRRALHPLKRLAMRTEGIEAHKLSYRFDDTEIPKELIPIVTKLNALMERLEKSFADVHSAYERERRFSDNVAHELRTPLAELHTMNEVALLFQDRDQNPEEVFSETLSTVRQMEEIVTALLLLGRCESDIQEEPGTLVSLSDLVRESWSGFANEAEKKALCAEFAFESCCQAARSGLLRTVVNNLIANAVRYSVPSTTIQFRIERVTDGCRLVIENEVTDLESSDLDKLFEPFWQKDAAHSNNENHGLGLAIVQAICKTLEIDIQCHLTGTVVSFELFFHAVECDKCIG